jgi:hypothetical protein
LDMMSHHLYDKYNCPVKKPMRKASLHRWTCVVVIIIRCNPCHVVTIVKKCTLPECTLVNNKEDR